MDSTRRRFLKIAGLSALGLGLGSKAEGTTLGAKGEVKSNPDAISGKRWAMAVDLKKFKEGGRDLIDKCVQACHLTHNVPYVGNPKEDVKWLWPEAFGHAFPSQESETLHHWVEKELNGLPVLVLCNHCDNPPCVRVCPTKATFRREDGVVMMDYHRCIGCRYCMAACPYGARSLNWRDPRPFLKELNREFPTRTRGVVEKCNFCAERLAVGKKPACVEASGGALVFGDMDDPHSEVRDVLERNYSIRRKPQLGTRPQVYYIL